MIRRQFALTAMVVFLIGVSSGLSAFESKARFAVPHAFMADGKEYPAGDYEVSLDGSSANQLTLRNVKTNQIVVVRYITRLSQSQDNQTSVAFDVAGDTYYLSEVHFAGVDGFHLQGAPGPHTHTVIKASK